VPFGANGDLPVGVECGGTAPEGKQLAALVGATHPTRIWDDGSYVVGDELQAVWA
jgi:hypothetical protein